MIFSLRYVTVSLFSSLFDSNISLQARPTTATSPCTLERINPDDSTSNALMTVARKGSQA
jgi:hypothetical protein